MKMMLDFTFLIVCPLRPCHTIAYRTSVCQGMKNIIHTPVYVDIRYGYVIRTYGLYDKHTLGTR
jgi:hypothetical protein